MPDNEHDDDLPRSDKLTMILLHVGETRKGIKRLEDDVREVKDSISTLENHTVRKDECTQRHVVVANSIGALGSDLKEIRDGVREIKRKSGAGYPAVGAMASAPQEIVEEVLEQRQEKTRKTLTFWLSLIGSVAALAGGTATGVYKLVKYLDRVDQTVGRSSKESTAASQAIAEEIRKVLAREPRVIYVKSAADAPPDQPAKRPRRRNP